MGKRIKLENLPVDLILSDFEKDPSVVRISKKYNTYTNLVSKILRENNLKVVQGKRKYSYDESYFEKINTEEKAYFFGFICADGHITKKSTLSIHIHKRDADILEKFKKSIKYNGEISFRTYKTGKNDNFESATLNICHNKIGQDLINLGCIQQKSLKLRFPSENHLPENLLRHFIRGFFDGNGYFSKYVTNNKEAYCFGISSTLEFTNKLKEIFNSKLDINLYLDNNQHTKIPKNVRKAAAGGKKNLLKFLQWIYADSNIYLDRKYDKYKKFLESENLKEGDLYPIA